MREILNISIGQCGNQIAAKVRGEALESSVDFHLDSSSGKWWPKNTGYLLKGSTVAILICSSNESMSTSMKPTVADMYPARSCVISKAARSMLYVPRATVRCSNRIISFLAHLVRETIGPKVSSDTCIELGSTSPDFHRGYYGEGAETILHILDAVRREVENTDCMQGNVLLGW